MPPVVERAVCRIDELTPAPYNPRSISEAAKRGLAASIDRFGMVQEIVVNRRNMRVVGGHQRLDVMRGRGETQVPVAFVDLDEAEEKMLNVTLNNPTIAGEFTDNLQSLLDEFKYKTPQLFTSLNLDKLISDLSPRTGNIDPDDVPPANDMSIAKSDDLWVLGEHRLLCGDASDQKNYGLLLGEDRADMVFTDPPYGIDYGEKNRFLNSFQPSGRNLKDIANDAIGKDELFGMLVKAFSGAKEFSQDHCSYYVTAPQGGELGLMMMMMMSGLPVRHVLIWNKDSQNFSLGRLDYEYKHEPILYTWKKTHQFYAGGRFLNSVWDIPKPKKSEEHPTMKPVELVENALLNSSQRDNVVLDMFAGSGTTSIAAERTGRRARLMEIDPHYCDVIIARWEKFTGKKAEKVK